MKKTTAYARKRAHQDAWQRTRHEACNPVTEAVVRQRIEADIQRLRTDTGLQAIDRLMPKLHTFSLAAGSMELDNLLHSTSGMGTADVRRALGMQT